MEEKKILYVRVFLESQNDLSGIYDRTTSVCSQNNNNSKNINNIRKIKTTPLSICGISPMECIMDAFAKILDF